VAISDASPLEASRRASHEAHPRCTSVSHFNAIGQLAAELMMI